MANDRATDAIEFPYRARDFEELKRFALQHAGITLTDSRRHLVYSRVVRRVRSLGLSNVAEYCRVLRDGDAEEISSFIHVITTHVTQFFREYPQLEMLAKLVQTGALSHAQPIALWSAGCSSGEEAYSIAMVLADALGGPNPKRYTIRGTDVDRHIVETARAGVYEERAIHDIDRRYRRYFLRGTGANQGLVRVHPNLTALAHFDVGNLFGPWPTRKYDIIFCRNVMIYFTPEQIQTLIDRFASHLKVGGHLFIGHSENIGDHRDRFDALGQNAFRLRAKV